MANQKYDPERGELNWLRAVAHPRDSEFASLCQQFVKKTPQERTAMRAVMNTKDASALLGFASLAAHHAIREQSSDWAINGLTAVAMIEAEQFDFRDILVALGLLHHAATRTGLDADQLFRDWAALAEPKTAKMVEGFASRAQGQKELKAWSYEEAATDAGIVLIRGGFGRSKPTYDLVAIVADMAEHFVADKYRYPTCEFGKVMPTLWLHSEDDTALNQALKAFRTGASISAELRPTTGVKEFSQLRGVPVGDEERGRRPTDHGHCAEERAKFLLQGRAVSGAIVLPDRGTLPRRRDRTV
jgi:hypothetical protein